MAGYVKMWTWMRHNEVLVSGGLNEKGAFAWLLILCKDQRDDGWIFLRDFPHLASEFGCDVKTARKILGKFQESSLVKYTESDSKTRKLLTIEIPNYIEWQELDVKSLVEKSRKNPRKIPPIRPDKTKPNKIRLDHSSETSSDHREAIKYFTETYQKEIGAKYDFKSGKDGKLIKDLLKTFNLEQLKALIDQLFKTKDQFIISQAGRTIGILSACSNKLVQEFKRDSLGLSKLSPAGQATMLNLAEVLREEK